MTKRRVTIVEVGPRDGLQNETAQVTTADKLALIDLLARAGLGRIEATAFVSPRWVPQMADHDAVMRGASRRSGVVYSALVPNEKGAEAALAAGAQALAVFTAASETFSRRNTNCSVAEGISRFIPVVALARRAGVPVRGYVSCALDCPYEGAIGPAAVAEVSTRLFEIGCDEIALSDTIGRGTPERTSRMVEAALEKVPATQLAGHFHDTSGRAIANVAAAWTLGVSVFDGSVGGLGGCPYAPGATGNLATETLVTHFEQSGLETRVDLERLREVARWIRARTTEASGCGS
ncbi:Isopropylmalate/homocitrate/citramalate synthase [Bosea sp. LC85]|uniref:hydroxymethylglutaryl-CoA lyase n=1 Tax=Bosea sp. LC85 TaxID=1502851 RepID=UPI0004E440E7|nr:hydroxymethylglutaryl-CoA lyase [Bosea sp. LC85]KFC66857.1 Isopropylmalate/homocitrate/citramalate synthase [Bosea sp. LC85]